MADLATRQDAFCDALGYRFADAELFELALTHRSWCAENPGYESNERLEFLGDAVLDLAITEVLYENEPGQQEGSLAKARAEVVSAASLANVARELGLGSLLHLGKGEELSGGRDKDSILADAIEAVFGAIHLDRGWSTAADVVKRLLGPAAARAQSAPGERDYKTRLQELAAENGMPAPSYTIRASGPDHALVFSAVVEVGAVEATGRGQSKKRAEQLAAERAMDRLVAEPDVASNCCIRESKEG